jgi:DNA-binding response OmpR family regulator/HPt (histidine-containing phosphotransfer) domain-containing protein
VRILLVEDDEIAAELLRKNLTHQHYFVDVASDGQAGWELADAFEYDLILLDFMLPKLDGLSLCRQLRAQGDHTPILLLTAYDSSTEKVTGLDAGADDYVVKPYDFEELLARIRALLRRGNAHLSPVMTWGKLCLDPSSCKVTYDEQLLQLTSKEYALIELFLRNSQQIFSQGALLDHLWSFEEPPLENTVRAHIKSLRRKLERAGGEDLIETVYGLGYRLRALDVRKQETKTSPVPLAGTTVDQISPELGLIWERVRDQYSARITILEQTVTALAKGRLTEELQQQGVREAHTLIGSLGSFGLAAAARLSREIEQRFKAEPGPDQTHAAHLARLLKELRHLLEQPQISLQPQVRPISSVIQQPRLLVIGNDPELADALKTEAIVSEMQAEVVTNLPAAREAIASAQPDVVLLDLSSPDSVEDGFGLLAELAAAQPSVPVLVITAQESFVQRVKSARLGGRGFLQKPISPKKAMEAIHQVLQPSGTAQAKLMIVDDDPQILDLLHTLLEPWGFALTLLDDPTQFWDTLKKHTPDLLILDIEMPDFSGIDLCQVVRNDPDWSELPVLFLSAHTDSEMVHRLFAVGADDYVSKPILGPELVARVVNRLERTQILRKLASQSHER